MTLVEDAPRHVYEPAAKPDLSLVPILSESAARVLRCGPQFPERSERYRRYALGISAYLLHTAAGFPLEATARALGTSLSDVEHLVAITEKNKSGYPETVRHIERILEQTYEGLERSTGFASLLKLRAAQCTHAPPPLRSDSNLRHVAAVVCHLLNVPMGHVYSRKRSRRVTDARFIAMSLGKCMRPETRTLPFIGNHFKRDHTSVLHALRTVNDAIRGSNSLGASILLPKIAFVCKHTDMQKEQLVYAGKQ